jgi:hypothetical protein
LKGYIRKKIIGRPKGRWRDAVDMDAERMLKYKNWRRSANDEDVRRRIEEAKAQVEL